MWNCLKGDGNWAEDTWYPVVIEHARLIISKGHNMMTSGLEAADSARLHISDEISIPSKPYIGPIAWAADPEAYYTLESANHSFFTEGDTSAEDAGVHDDFFSYMAGKYDHCYRISNVDRFEVIPHFEVWGK